MTSSIIYGKDLVFKYSKNEIFNGITFSFERGYIIGLLGENGSGKTTLFDLISGNITPTSGNLIVNVKAEDIAYLPQVVTLPPALRINEVLEMMSCFQGISANQTYSRLASLWPKPMLVRYDEIKRLRTGVCSYGEKRWFATAALLAIYKRSLFLLDEPTAGVDVQYRYLIWQCIKQIKNLGCTVIVSSHLLDEIGANTDLFYFLKNSNILKFNNMQEFMCRFDSASPDEAFINATVVG